MQLAEDQIASEILANKHNATNIDLYKLEIIDKTIDEIILIYENKNINDLSREKKLIKTEKKTFIIFFFFNGDAGISTKLIFVYAFKYSCPLLSVVNMTLKFLLIR